MAKTQNPSDFRSMFGQYAGRFQPVICGEKKTLKDPKSKVQACLEMQAGKTGIYVAKPDGDLIPDALGQKKCDYLIYCHTVPQTVFVELKGKIIDRAYAQILDTIQYLELEESLKDLVNGSTEKFAFIVSPLPPKIPKGGHPKERQLMRKLRMGHTRDEKDKKNLIYYVKVHSSENYTVAGNRITCSNVYPVVFPFCP